LTGTNGGSTILGVEGYVKTAKEYLRVAQSHVEEFARFIEALESSQKASTRNRSSSDDVSILEGYSRTMTRGSSQQSKGSLFNEENIYSSNPYANETDEVKKGLSDLGQKTYMDKDQAIIPPTSIKSTNGEKRMLILKDRNRILHPKSDLVEKSTWPPAREKAPRSEMKRWRPSLTGENEPWAAFTPLDTPQFPRNPRKSNSPEHLDEKLVQQKQRPKAPEEIRPESTEYSPSTRSRNSDRSFSTLEKIFPKLSRGESPGMYFAIGNNLLPEQGSTTQRQGQMFQDFQLFDALDDDFEMYGHAMGSGFDLAPSIDQQIPQKRDDPFVLSVQDSESLLTQTASEYIPAGDATIYTPQTHLPSSNMHKGNFINEECFQSPPKSTGHSSDAAPWTIISRDTASLALQSSPYTPTSRRPQQLMELGMLEGQNKVLGIDWSLQDFD
jgi:hypothetical protein